MMLRQAVSRVVRQRSSHRYYAAAAPPGSKGAKRALNKEQLKGSTTTTPTTTPPPTNTGKASSSSVPSPPPPESGGGGSTSVVPFAIAGLVAVGGAAYFMGVIPGMSTTEEEKKNVIVEEPVVAKEEEQLEQPDSVDTPVAEEEKKIDSVTTNEEEEETAPATTTGNRVITIDVPNPSTRDEADVVPAISHPDGGNKVTMEPPSKNKKKRVSALEAAKELRLSSAEETNETLALAHKTLNNHDNDSLLVLKDLDELNENELRVRVVQLMTEMGERTKWEAYRLKEFLAMKEQETADKYEGLLQKQRLELDELLARKLREQDDSMTRRANAALQQKDGQIKAIVDATTDSMASEHQAQLQSLQERLDTQLAAKHEVEYSRDIAAEKKKFIAGLESKASAIQNLAQTLAELESALSSSRAFSVDSLQAHRLSAAALTLSEKLGTNKGASKELQALLKTSAAAAGDNNNNSAIASAVASIPVASVEKGVPTVSELQSKFESIHNKVRQAALVPEGHTGLEGQLMGMALSSVKFAPDPAVNNNSDSDSDPDYCVARARQHVQSGDLESAVGELNKLEGRQVSFTIKDWKQNATDRVAIDKALHIIKTECAALNQTMSSSSST